MIELYTWNLYDVIKQCRHKKCNQKKGQLAERNNCLGSKELIGVVTKSSVKKRGEAVDLTSAARKDH